MRVWHERNESSNGQHATCYMRIALAAVIGAVTAGAQAGAQTAEPQRKVAVTPYVGYQFGGAVEAQAGRVSINDGLSYGALIDFGIGNAWQLEASYRRQDTELRLDPRGGGPATTLSDVAVQYIQIGGIANYLPEQALRPFLGLSAGVVVMDPASSTFGTSWRGATILTGGFKLGASPRVSALVQTSMLMVLFNPSATFFCAGGGGCGTGVGWRAMLQGEVLGGLTVKF